MKRIIKKNKLLLSIFFVITIVLYIGLNNVLGCYFDIDRNSSRYSSNAVEFRVDNNNGNKNTSLKDICNILKDNHGFLQFSLHKKIDEKYVVNAIYRGMASHMKFEFSKGGNFTDKDYDRGANAVIIKDEVYNSLKKDRKIKSDGVKEYIEYCGFKFYIKGIINSSICPSTNAVYINVYSIANKNDLVDEIESYNYIYDCGKDTRSNLKKIAQKYKNLEINISELTKGQEALISSISINKIYVIAVALLLIICFLTIGSVSCYWFRKETKELGIRKLVGAHNSSLTFVIIKRYFAVCITGMISGMLCFEILKRIGFLNNFINFKSTLGDDCLMFISGFIIISIFLFVVLINPIIKVFRLQINTVIRGAE